MQFWFNTSVVNETEEIIDAYFHIYKRRAMRPPGVPQGSHRVSVRTNARLFYTRVDIMTGTYECPEYA